MSEQAPVSTPAPSGAKSDPRLGGVFAAGLASAGLFSVSLVVPVLPAAVVAPFPLLLQRLRGGGNGPLASLLALALVAVVFSPGHAAVFALLVAPVLAIGEAMVRGRGLVRGCAWAFLLFAAEIALALAVIGPQMSSFLVEPFAQLRTEPVLSQLRARLPPEQVASWAEQATTWQAALGVVFPAAYLVSAGLVVLANGALLRFYLAKRDPGWLEGGEFERLRFPIVTALAFIGAGASVAVEALRPVAYNALVLLAFFFALQGLAVVVFYAHRLAAPPLLRMGVVVLVLVNAWSTEILALLGLFDLFIDFRKWAEPPDAREAR
jgi:Predicted membrane protein (DUF2232)